MTTVISVEHLSKTYRLGQIGTGTFSRDLEVWWAKLRGKPNPLLRIGETDPAFTAKGAKNAKEESGLRGSKNQEDNGTIWALKDINFTVEQGEVLGIIGKNGAGKSTLLKILSRVTAPTSGKVKVKGRIASLLEVGTGFHPELTGRENIYLNGAILGMSRKEIDRKFDEIVDFAEVEKFIDTPVKRYSSGMYVRLAFAVAAHLDPEILVVDEVLAVGDAEFQNKCLGKMGEVAGEGRTVLFVSHNMASISNLCSSATLIDHGRILGWGTTENIIEEYLAQSSAAQKSSCLDLNLCRPAWATPLITSIRLIDSSGESRTAFPMGADLTFELTFDTSSNLPLKSPNMGVVISHSTRGIVGGVNGRMSGTLVGDRSFTSAKIYCILNSPPLLQGKYSVDIYLGDSKQDYDCLLGCITFNIDAIDIYGSGVSPYGHLGVIYFESSWQVTPIKEYQ